MAKRREEGDAEGKDEGAANTWADPRRRIGSDGAMIPTPLSASKPNAVQLFSPPPLPRFFVCHSNSSSDNPRRHTAVHPSELPRAHSPINHARTQRLHPRHLSEEHAGSEKTRQPLAVYGDLQAFTDNTQVSGQNVRRAKDKKPTEARTVHCTSPKRTDARRPRRHSVQQRRLWLRVISRCLPLARSPSSPTEMFKRNQHPRRPSRKRTCTAYVHTPTHTHTGT